MEVKRALSGVCRLPAHLNNTLKRCWKKQGLVQRLCWAGPRPCWWLCGSPGPPAQATRRQTSALSRCKWSKVAKVNGIRLFIKWSVLPQGRARTGQLQRSSSSSCPVWIFLIKYHRSVCASSRKIPISCCKETVNRSLLGDIYWN